MTFNLNRKPRPLPGLVDIGNHQSNFDQALPEKEVEQQNVVSRQSFAFLSCFYASGLRLAEVQKN